GPPGRAPRAVPAVRGWRRAWRAASREAAAGRQHRVSLAVCEFPGRRRRHPSPFSPPAGGSLPAGDPMAPLGMNDVKNGQKILVNNEPAIITDTDYVKPGK